MSQIFLVVEHDDHAEPNYYAYRDKQLALDLARKLADKSKERYRNMPVYIEKGLFNECGEERWRVLVCEVKLQE